MVLYKLSKSFGTIRERKWKFHAETWRHSQRRLSNLISLRHCGVKLTEWTRSGRARRCLTAAGVAPGQRNPPEIFCRSFIMRPSCSARLLVKGHSGIGQEAQHVVLAGAQTRRPESEPR